MIKFEIHVRGPWTIFKQIRGYVLLEEYSHKIDDIIGPWCFSFLLQGTIIKDQGDDPLKNILKHPRP